MNLLKLAPKRSPMWRQFPLLTPPKREADINEGRFELLTPVGVLLPRRPGPICIFDYLHYLEGFSLVAALSNTYPHLSLHQNFTKFCPDMITRRSALNYFSGFVVGASRLRVCTLNLKTLVPNVFLTNIVWVNFNNNKHIEDWCLYSWWLWIWASLTWKKCPRWSRSGEFRLMTSIFQLSDFARPNVKCLCSICKFLTCSALWVLDLDTPTPCVNHKHCAETRMLLCHTSS